MSLYRGPTLHPTALFLLRLRESAVSILFRLIFKYDLYSLSSFYFVTIPTHHGYQLHPTYTVLLVQVQVLCKPACCGVLRPLQAVLLLWVTLVAPKFVSEYQCGKYQREITNLAANP